MANEMIRFLRGNVASLPQTATAGAVYFTKDEGLYLGLEDGTYHRYGDFITVADVASLPAAGAHETCMYYCEAENVLAKWDGSKWVQINKQKTLAELGGVAKSVYEEKMAALEKADTDNATAVSNLSTYVGTIPETASATNIVAYVQEKTSGIATSENLQELTNRVTVAEGDIDKLEAAIGENGSVTNKIAAAQSAAEAAQATADSKVTMAQVEAKDYATKAEAQGYANAKDEAIAAAQSKADAAHTLAGSKATMEEVNAAIAGAGHAVKSEVDQAIAGLDSAYKAADSALETKLQGNIDKKVDQTAYDAKIAELAGADVTLQGNIDAEAKTREDADKAQVERIAALEGQITGLSGAMHFKGIKNEIPEDVTGYADGDVIIVGDKEYVFNAGEFVEFGDVSAEGDRISALETAVGGENSGLVKGVADNAAAIAAEKSRAEGKEAELAQSIATNLQTAKDYADDAVEALGIGDYIKKADADAAYAVVGHNHDDKYDAIGAAAQALIDAKAYADTAKSDAISDAEGKVNALANGAVAANTAAIATKATQADLDNAVTRIGTAEGKITALEGASATHALKTEVEAVQTALDTYKSENNAAVALKANAADVYAKTETYAKSEVYTKSEVEAMLTWGSFGA